MTDLRNKTISELGQAIDTGKLDPRELTAAFLDAAEAHEHSRRIYARLTRARAEAEAEAAAERARLGLRRSPLDGVPVSWKDLFDTAGTVTEAGSALLADRTPSADARVLKNATAQGLVCLGKTHMSELAFSGLGLNPVTETPPCINDESAVPGGSSSGAAASVAFSLAPGAIGSDTGGSVRIPSAWNDLVGLKTTASRVSLDGVVPLCAKFDTVGPLSRSVEDAALTLAALEGSKAADLNGASLHGKRLAVLDTLAFEDIRPEPAAAFEEAVAKLAKAGADITHITAPEVTDAMSLSAILYTSEAYGTWQEVIEAAPEKMFPQILERFRAGAEFNAPDYVAAWHTLEAARFTWHARAAAFDAVLIPTAPILPPNAARLLTDEDYYVTENLLALRNTRIGNVLGLCAVTLPTGVPSCGVSLMGAPFTEERLLRLSAAAERALA